MRIYNSAKAGTKKPRTMPGLKVCRRQEIGLVPRDGRATEAEIDARSDHINVLTDRVGAEYAAGRDARQHACRCGGGGGASHENGVSIHDNPPNPRRTKINAPFDDRSPPWFPRPVAHAAR